MDGIHAEPEDGNASTIADIRRAGGDGRSNRPSTPGEGGTAARGSPA
jgi:hypothetical protein